MGRVDAATVKYWQDVQRIARHHLTDLWAQAERLQEVRLYEVADCLDAAADALDVIIRDHDPEEKGGQD